MNGVVYLVGAGPGDPGLLTRRAADLIARADLVAVDALVSPEIVATIRCELVYVGKRAAAHTLPQDQINQLLIDEARKGKCVVRLKGGDPFVFGRGGEEAEDLAAAGVAFEVVPGISSAIAAPAYAGIPVTHRAHATSFTVVTGHESDESTGVDWDALAKLRGTIVFLMGFANLATIAKRLPADRHVAVISKGTTLEQRTVTGTLADIEQRVAAAKLETPALIVVGDVVKMHDVINWFETKPLFGKRVVVTRAREQASELKRLLEEAGAQVVQFPTIEIAPPSSFESLDRVIESLNAYQWLIFTSHNGVKSFFERLESKTLDARVLHGLKIAAVGESTANDLRAHGIVADLVPPKFISTALLPLLAEDQRGIRTAVVRAAEGRDDLIDELRKRGGEVDLAIAYETRAAGGSLDGTYDYVTFTSASTVDNFFAKVTDTGTARLVSIGPATTAAIEKHGRRPDVEAASASVESLRDAIVEHERR
jgi:uroporphyrinogen III methyltransferase/synthase